MFAATRPTVQEHYREMWMRAADRAIFAAGNGQLPLWMILCVNKGIDALKREAGA